MSVIPCWRRTVNGKLTLTLTLALKSDAGLLMFGKTSTNSNLTFRLTIVSHTTDSHFLPHNTCLSPAGWPSPWHKCNKNVFFLFPTQLQPRSGIQLEWSDSNASPALTTGELMLLSSCLTWQTFPVYRMPSNGWPKSWPVIRCANLFSSWSEQRRNYCARQLLSSLNHKRYESLERWEPSSGLFHPKREKMWTSSSIDWLFWLLKSRSNEKLMLPASKDQL